MEYFVNKSTGLPSWETERPSTSCASLPSAIVPRAEGRWYKDRAGLYLFEPHGCSLKRFTADEARQCFAGNSIAFVGDSLTRWEGGGGKDSLTRWGGGGVNDSLGVGGSMTAWHLGGWAGGGGVDDSLTCWVSGSMIARHGGWVGSALVDDTLGCLRA